MDNWIKVGRRAGRKGTNIYYSHCVRYYSRSDVVVVFNCGEKHVA